MTLSTNRTSQTTHIESKNTKVQSEQSNCAISHGDHARHPLSSEHADRKWQRRDLNIVQCFACWNRKSFLWQRRKQATAGDDKGHFWTQIKSVHYAEVPLKIVTFKFAIPSLDNSTVLCLTLLSLIVNPLILRNTFWSYKILVSFSTIFKLGLPAKASLWLKNVFSSTGNKIWSLVYTRLE